MTNVYFCEIRKFIDNNDKYFTMKKLLKGVLSFAIVAIVGIPQINAAGDANYTIQVKNKYYDKEYNGEGARKGLAYTTKSEYTSNTPWILVEGYHPYSTSFTTNYYDPYNQTTSSRTCYVKQFGVSKGVVYWINPSENVIRYWNTVDGTSGTLAPTGTYQGTTYSFKGSDTGYGSITHDWYGNLVHVWNGKSGTTNNINTPARGYAVYKAPTTYGTVINSAPILSDMPTCDVPHVKRSGSSAAWEDAITTPNPNILKDIYLNKNKQYTGSTLLNNDGVASGGYLNGNEIAVDFLSASGNLCGAKGEMYKGSAFQGGYASGYLWQSYGYLVTGSIFAEGAYANWFLNYRVTTDKNTPQIPDGSGSYGNGLLNYSREFFFQEATGGYKYSSSDTRSYPYFYSSPGRGFYHSYNSEGITQYPTQIVPRGSTGGTDPTVVQDIYMLKGYEIYANSLQKLVTDRNNAFDVNVVGGGRSADNRIGYAWAYNETKNSNPLANSSLNAWLEFEKINENVLALYTYSPGQGFSKFYVTAVRSNNKVSGVSISEYKSINNLYPQAKITWTAQPYDRETLHRYLIYYKAYASSTDATTVNNMTWQLATVDANGNPKPVDIGTATTGTFYHNTPVSVDANGKKSKLTYKYLIVPIYDGSDHMGEETETGTFEPTIPTAIVKGNLYQVTDNGGPNGETRYGFSVRLDPYFDADAVGATSATRFVITSAGGVPGWEALKEASSVTLADGTPLTFVENASFTEKGGNSATVVNQYTLDIPVTVGTDGKLPSIIWHNVDPSKTFQVGLHVEYTKYADFSAQNPGGVTLYVPNATVDMSLATIQPLEGDYSFMQRKEHLPLGAQREVGSDEVTNPVTISKVNTLGTRGSAINPLLVTDEVLENWNVQYLYNVFKDGDFVVAFDFDDSKAASGVDYYSNEKKVMIDVVGLPVKKTPWDTHTALSLSDAQKATNENIIKQGYDKSTSESQYSVHIDVTYTRKDNSIVVEKGGENEASSPIVFSDAVKDGKIFPDLGVGFGSTLALLKRTSTHWDVNANVEGDNDEYGGYFPIYYDAVAQWAWPNYNSDLNHYVGFHAVTKMNCVGHNIKYADGTTSKDWIPYYAPEVLSDFYVEQTNITLNKEGNATANTLGDPLTLKAIGYDGTKNTDWSALAAEAKTLPMQVHYVWGGDSELTNSEEDRKSVQFSVLMTADYPIIESEYGATIIHDQTGDESYYNLVSDCNAKVATMSMISSYNASKPWADYITTVTGVEGIITEACGGWNLYPNPVGSTFTLEAPVEMDNVKIFTTTGQLVKSITDVNATKATINVDDLPQGVYVINTLGVAKMMIKM